MKNLQNRGSPQKKRWGSFGYVGNMAAFAVLISNILLPVAPVFASEDAPIVDAAPQIEETAAPEVSSQESEPEVEVEETPSEITADDTTAQPEEVATDKESAGSEDQAPDDMKEDVLTDQPQQSENSEETEEIIKIAPETPATSTSEQESNESISTSTEEEQEGSNADTKESEVASTTDKATSSAGGDVFTAATGTASGGVQDSEVLGASTTAEAASSTEVSTTATTTDGVPQEESIANVDETVDKDLPNADPPAVDVVNDPLSEGAPTTTEDVPKESTLQPVNIVFNDENRYLFSKDECVSVGDGSFYCTEATTAGAVEEADKVFASTDKEGDREIYIDEGSGIVAITNNMTDDDAPYYDEVSDTIVWHRLIDGRYQIMEYDLTTQKERQLTTERYNNMQPTREGDTIVWQGWVGSDWEVLIEQNGELEMLTDNDFHDIAPHINGDYIIWQSFEGEVWNVKVYDTKTGKTETISDDTGGSAQNPRFVLVYDTKLENGDIETKGYDLESGQVVPLSSRPAPVPTNIPDPDPTDEDRAMVQQVVQLKTKSESETDDGIDDATGTTTDVGDIDDEALVVPPLEDTTATSSDESLQHATGTADIADVEIPALSSESQPIASSSEQVIPDVVIPPFNPTTTPSTTADRDTTATST